MNEGKEKNHVSPDWRTENRLTNHMGNYSRNKRILLFAPLDSWFGSIEWTEQTSIESVNKHWKLNQRKKEWTERCCGMNMQFNKYAWNIQKNVYTNRDLFIMHIISSDEARNWWIMNWFFSLSILLNVCSFGRNSFFFSSN